MKIVFHRYGSICEPDIIAAFHSLNLEVIEEDTEITQKKIAPEERIRLLAEAVLIHRPLFVFSINYFPYISQICERLQVLYICLSVDCPVLELFSDTIRNRYNRIFLFDRSQYQEIKALNPNCIFHLPLAVNVNRWDQILSTSNKLQENNRRLPQEPEVSFIGSLYTEKSPYTSLALSKSDRKTFDELIEAQLANPGLSLIDNALTDELALILKHAAVPGVFHTLPDAFQDTDMYVAVNYILGMRISELERIRLLNMLAKSCPVHLFTRSDTSPLHYVHCHGGVSTHQEMPIIFHRSKINLNITIRSIREGLSQRIWDVLGCKGFLLTNYQGELSDYFEIGKDLDCYESPEECLQKIQYYLSHEDLRREIADNGYQKVKAMHTYEIRIAQILQTVFT